MYFIGLGIKHSRGRNHTTLADVARAHQQASMRTPLIMGHPQQDQRETQNGLNQPVIESDAVTEGFTGTE
jgi:hypothetical protein